MPDFDTLLHRLDSREYKRTGPRALLLAEIARRVVPFTAAELWTALQQQQPTIGRATVFRNLDLFAERGVVQRMRDEHGGGFMYLACGIEHHHHLVCSHCKAVSDFVEGDLERLIAAAAARRSFQMEAHRLELYGICAACRAAEERP